MIDLPSPNHDERPAALPVDILVIHYTGMQSAAIALDRLRDPEAKVSAHYVIDEDGSVLRMVAEERRAWHAGKAYWRGARDINSRSIGIELVNPGHEFGYRPFPQPQMAALCRLAQEVLARHPIPPRNIVGHSDIAPERKLDPGEFFDWQHLARHGIGVWPGRCRPESQPGEQRLPEWDWPVEDVQRLLGRIGYEAPVTGRLDEHAVAVIRAFQRHFRPVRVDGALDLDTVRQVERLADLVG